MPIYRKLNRNSPIYSSLCEVFQTWQIVVQVIYDLHTYILSIFILGLGACPGSQVLFCSSNNCLCGAS